jgi:hypothetical protein
MFAYHSVSAFCVEAVVIVLRFDPLTYKQTNDVAGVSVDYQRVLAEF